MSKIAEAYVEISAKFDRLQKDLDVAKKKFSSATDDMHKSSKRLEDGMSGLMGKLRDVKALYVAASAVIASGFVVAMTSAVRATANHLDQLDEMSVKTGVSVDMLTSLELAAKQNGVSMDQLATSIRMMYRSMNEAAEGTKESADAYKILGVNVKDSGGNLKSGNEAFIEIADKISKIENPAQRSAMAMKVFGRAGAEMLPMLEGGRIALEGYIGQAQKLGLVFTSEDAKRAAAFNDVLDAFMARLTALRDKISLEVLPPLTKLLSYLSGADVPDVIKKKDIDNDINQIQKILYKLQNGITLSTSDMASGWGYNIDYLKKKLAELGKEAEALDEKIAAGGKNSVGGGGAVGGFASLISNSPGMAGARQVMTWEEAAKKANEAALSIRGVQKASTELVENFELIPEVLDEVKISITDKLVAPFEDMTRDLQRQWEYTIKDWMQGGTTFGNFMADMFSDVLQSFMDMLAQMAAQELAESLFSSIVKFGGAAASVASGNISGVDVVGPGTGAPMASKVGTTVINISAIDTQSFAAAVRRNPDAVISVVQEARMYGRAS